MVDPTKVRSEEKDTTRAISDEALKLVGNYYVFPSHFYMHGGCWLFGYSLWHSPDYYGTPTSHVLERICQKFLGFLGSAPAGLGGISRPTRPSRRDLTVRPCFRGTAPRPLRETKGRFLLNYHGKKQFPGSPQPASVSWTI